MVETLICDPATATCALPPKAGQPCVDGRCDPFSAYCFNEICEPQVEDGQRCTPTPGIEMCHPRRYCFNGVCIPGDPGYAYCDID